MSKFANVFNGFKTSVSKHAPEILMGVGITGMITSTILAVKATPKAVKLVEEAKKQKGEDLTPVEMVKASWKCYIPTVAVAAASTACLVGASTISGRRNAALATAFTLTETAFKEYKETVEETVEEEVKEKIKDKVAEKQVKKNPVDQNTVIVNAAGGDVLCYDALSGRYFRSDKTTIDSVVNKLNYQINNNFYVSLNEFYEELGLEENDMGYQLGWNNNSGLIEIDYSSQLSPKQEPCLVVSFRYGPVYDYQSLY